MNKSTFLLKPLTAAVLLTVSFTVVESCRKPIVSPFADEPSLAVVPSGIIALSESSNGTLQVITAAGNGIAGPLDGTGGIAQFNRPAGVATDASGNVYVADMSNNKIRKITTDGVVSTFAGSGAATYGEGTGTAASFNTPSSVATDAAGNVYVADKNNHLIRKITPAGVVSTLAGGVGMPGNAEGPGIAARFSYPVGVAVKASGNVFVADAGSHKIRKVSGGC